MGLGSHVSEEAVVINKETTTIVWMSGVTVIEPSHRIEDDAIVFGATIDGVWKENFRMTFGGHKETKAMALETMRRL